MSFQSPLFKRPGAEDGTSHSPATLDDEFLRRRRTPGTTERPVGSPLFSNNNNATAHQFQRPSPLGLNFQSQGEGGATTTPSGRFLGGGSARTPSSTGTNFKARLQAMQTIKSNTTAAAGTPTTGAGFRLPTTPSSTTGLARPGQLGPLSSSTRSASTTSIFLAKQQQRQSGPPPPVSSLEDELLNLKIDLTTGRDRDDVDTPIKSGMKLNLGSTTTSSRLTTTPTATTTKTPSGDDNGNVSKAGSLPSFSFQTNTTPVGLTTSTKGTWTKGKKAVGAGALAVARSPLPGGGGVAGGSLVVPSIKDTTVIGSSIPASSTDAADKHGYGIIEKLPPQEKDEKEMPTSSRTKIDARSLQQRLRSELPEFGISEWSPPVAPTPHLTAKPVLPSTTAATSIEKTGALKELATLRNQAEVKLEGAFISRIIGGEIPSPLPMSSSQQQLRTTEESKGEEDDTLCRGVRSAFRSTLPELQIPSATPEAAAMPSSSSLSTRSTSLSPLERGTRRGAGGSVEKQQGRVVADEIEERLERLKLLRNQAVQVTNSRS